MVVMHVCDNKACLNPLHLLAGYQADNVSKEYHDARLMREIREGHWKVGKRNKG
jgi:hypothetical protein